MEEKDIIIQYEGKQYLLVEEFDYQDDKIYLFLGEEDEIYCYKKDEKYILLTDKSKKEKFLKQYNLVMPNYLRRLTDELHMMKDGAKLAYSRFKRNPDQVVTGAEKQKLITSFIDTLSHYQDKSIDLDRCYKRLNKVFFVKYNTNNSEYDNFSGAYNPSLDFLYTNINNKHVSFHEMIHASAGREYNIKNHLRWKIPFVEGITESSTHQLLGDTDYSIPFGQRYDIPNVNKQNFKSSYTGYVIMIRQLESVLGYTSVSSMINGTGNFEKDFINKYGLSFSIKLGYNMYKEPLSINQLQNNILSHCFDIDFKRAKTEDDIVSIMNRLRNISQYRGTAEDGKDEYFEDYYKKMYDMCISFMNNNNIDSTFMNKYKEVPRKKLYSHTDINKIIYDLYWDIFNMSKEYQDLLINNVNQITFKYKKDENNNYNFYVFLFGNLIYTKEICCTRSSFYRPTDIRISEDLEDINNDDYHEVLERFLDEYSNLKSKSFSA